MHTGPMENISKLQEYLALRKSEGLKTDSMKTTESHIRKFFEHLESTGKVLNEMQQTDFTQWVNYLRDRGLADSTVNNHVMQIRCFVRWALTGVSHGKGADAPYPECVRHLRVKAPFKCERLNEHATITQEIYTRIMDEARKRNTDLPVFIALLFDTGARRGEILPLKQKNIIPNGNSTYLEVRGKTGYRRIPVVSSLPILKDHLQKMPQNPEAYLFPGKNGHNGKSYFEDPLRYIVNDLKAEGLVPRDQRLTFHTFRHHRVTKYSTQAGWSNPMLETLFGWSKGSMMPSHYSHPTESDMATAVAIAQGLAEPDEQQQYDVLSCPNCEQAVPLAMKYCGYCGYAMNAVDRIEVDALKDDIDSMGPEAIEMWQAGKEALAMVNNPQFRAFMEKYNISSEAKAELT